MEINKHNQDIKKETDENKETNQTNEIKEIKEDKKVKESFLRRLYNEFKIGFQKNYKILILITIVALIIIYLNIPEKIYNNVMIGGDNENGQSKGNKSGNEGNEKKKKSFASKFSPLSGGINIMYWIAQNIILFYLFLIFLVLIPSVPIVLYITLFYFIMTSLLGRVTDI
jgi:hypothetical protein